MRLNKFAPKPGDDLIDFPVSVPWASYYAEQGTTKDYPPDFYRQPASLPLEQIRQLDEQIKRLELIKAAGPASKQEVYELKHMVNKLTERVNEINKKYGGY